MQINAILATLFAASASGAAIKSRYATGFTVTNFTASCIPHKGPDYLPAVGWTGCAEKGAYSWAVDKFEDGLKLRVTTPQDSHGNYTGVYEITADQFVVEQRGASISQRYTGPSDFTMPLGV
ncbi:hypothetical protein Daesc_008016 [Daldinia eschscholtzii]|uniref:Uncharacterized protein n=1 Tax=Daldinia eschscholtzii TaxID=292717 RepID=A0AAX6MH32_9PEZI